MPFATATATATAVSATAAGPHLFWITSRAAGIAALVLASLSVCLGLTMSLKLLRRRGPDLLALHEVLSLATLAAIAVHGLTLLGDGYLKATPVDIAIPFASSYRTVWTSLGILSGWGLALLGLSYYLRRWIGARRWRALHRMTALLWLAGLVHSLGEGSDAGQLWFLALIGLVVIPAGALLAVRLLTEPAPPNARRVSPSPGPSPAPRAHPTGERRLRSSPTAPGDGARRSRSTPRRPAPTGSRRS
jgi:sulfoxide reductase heme-binding subunit YedZ